MVGAITKLILPTRAAFPHAVIWRNEVRDYQHQLLSDTQRHQFFIFLYFYCFSLFTFALLHLVLCLECDCFYWNYHIHAQCRGKWEWVLYVGQWFRSFSLEEVMISHISMKDSLMSYVPNLGQTLTSSWEEQQVFSWEYCCIQQNKAFVHREGGRKWTLSVLL